MSTPSWQPMYPNDIHLEKPWVEPHSSHRSHLGKSEVLWPNWGLRKGTHKFRTKLHWAKSKILKVAHTNHPHMQLIVKVSTHTNPFMWNKLGTMLVERFFMERSVFEKKKIRRNQPERGRTPWPMTKRLQLCDVVLQQILQVWLAREKCLNDPLTH